MTKLIDDELEEDELFWNQEALKDVSKIHIFKKKKKKRSKIVSD
jgi:vacuolar protein sorting-associated protein 72